MTREQIPAKLLGSARVSPVLGLGLIILQKHLAWVPPCLLSTEEAW